MAGFVEVYGYQLPKEKPYLRGGKIDGSSAGVHSGLKIQRIK